MGGSLGRSFVGLFKDCGQSLNSAGAYSRYLSLCRPGLLCNSTSCACCWNWRTRRERPRPMGPNTQIRKLLNDPGITGVGWLRPPEVAGQCR